MTANSSPSAEHLVRGYSGRMFVLISCGVLVANLGRQAIPPLLPVIIDELAITAAAAGIALTIMRICFAIFQYPSGRVADIASRKIAVVGGLGIMVIGFVLLSQVPTYLVLVTSTALLGIGTAFFFVSERVLLSDHFVKKRGRVFGLNSAISRVGSILAAGLAVAALAVGSWQLAFLPVVLLLVGLVIAFHVGSRERYGIHELSQINRDSQSIRNTIRRVFGSAHIRWLVVAYTLIIFAWEGVMAFLPVYLQATKGFSAGFASGGFAMLFAVGVVVSPISGTMSDQWDRRFVAGIATFVSFVGLALLIGADSLILIMAGITLYAAGYMAFTPVLQAYLMDVFPDASKGGDLGAFKTVYEGLSSFGPTYVGVTVGFTSFDVAFGGMLVFLAISMLILLGMVYSPLT